MMGAMLVKSLILTHQSGTVQKGHALKTPNLSAENLQSEKNQQYMQKKMLQPLSSCVLLLLDQF